MKLPPAATFPVLGAVLALRLIFREKAFGESPSHDGCFHRHRPLAAHSVLWNSGGIKRLGGFGGGRVRFYRAKAGWFWRLIENDCLVENPGPFALYPAVFY